MNIDLSSYSYAELNELSTRVDKELKVRQVQEEKEAKRKAAKKKKELYAQMKELAEKHGMSVEEVVADAPGRGRRKKGAAAKGPKSPPKYYNPENPTQTWTGKGRKPGWLTTALENGASLEDLEIKAG